MTIQTITQLAKKINCLGIAAHLEARLVYAKQQGATYEDLLRQLFEDELDDRRQRVAARMIARARFRHNHSLEDWDSSYDRGISKRKLTELSHLHFYTNRESLVVLGSTGSGKSHLAVAIGRQMCASEIPVKFFSTHMFFEEVAAHRASGKYLSFLKNIGKIGAIIFDDFGLRNYTHDEATSLLELLEDRYQKGVVIFTSQIRPQGWKTLFEDQVIGDAIVDRILNPSQIVELAGESYRTKLSKRGKDMD